MLLSRKHLDRIAAGEIDRAFRRWKRPTVRAGGTLRTSIGLLAIDSVEPITDADVTEEDARLAGFVEETYRWYLANPERVRESKPRPPLFATAS